MSNFVIYENNLNVLSKFAITNLLCNGFSIHANLSYNKEEKLLLKDIELDKIK